MFKELKEFALKGKMVDMAAGIIIGAASGTIISSLVADSIMPPKILIMRNIPRIYKPLSYFYNIVVKLFNLCQLRWNQNE